MSKCNEIYVEQGASSEITRILQQIHKRKYSETSIFKIFKEIWQKISPERIYEVSPVKNAWQVLIVNNFFFIKI